MWTLNFDATCVEVIFENMTSVCDQVIQNWNLGNVQNERAAIIARWCSKGIGDVAPTSEWAKVVNRALFTLLANLWTCTGLHCLPICEAVQLCPACQFMQAENDGQIISKRGIVSLSYLWSIGPQVKICFPVFWTCDQLGNKLFLFPTSWRAIYFPTICREVVA